MSTLYQIALAQKGIDLFSVTSFNRMQIIKRLSYVSWLTNVKTTTYPGKPNHLNGTRLKKESGL